MTQVTALPWDRDASAAVAPNNFKGKYWRFEDLLMDGGEVLATFAEVMLFSSTATSTFADIFPTSTTGQIIRRPGSASDQIAHTTGQTNDLKFTDYLNSTSHVGGGSISIDAIPGTETRPAAGTNGWAVVDATQSNSSYPQIKWTVWNELTEVQVRHDLSTQSSWGGGINRGYVPISDSGDFLQADATIWTATASNVEYTDMPEILHYAYDYLPRDVLIFRLHFNRLKVDILGNVNENTAPTADLLPFSDGQDIYLVSQN